MSMSSMISMSNKRQFGVIGIDHTEYRHRAKRVLTSVGRHAPVAPQSIIAQQVVMCLPPQSSNPDPNVMTDLMAPRGDQFDAMIPKRGEWAVKIDVPEGESQVVAPYGFARISDTQITTCGNGTDIDAKIIFEGIVTNAQDLLDENRDNVGALDIGGTVTGINYGPERLCAGDHVYIGLPHMIESTINGHVTKVPSVCASGMPASKAHFGTYRMKWNNVSSAIEDIMEHIKEEYTKSNSKDTFADPGNLHAMLAVARGVRKELPLYQFACLFAHQTVCIGALNAFDVEKEDKADQTGKLVKKFNDFLVFMQKLDKQYAKVANTYDKSLGLAEARSDEPIQLMEQLDAKDKTEAFGGKVAKRLPLLFEFADRFKFTSFDLMQNFMRQRMMGKVLVNSDPGQQLDVALGYFA